MFDRIKRAIANWQDLAIWLPLMLGLLLATTYLLPRADPMAAVDGLGFLPAGVQLLHVFKQQGLKQIFLGGVVAIERCRLDADLTPKPPLKPVTAGL